MTQTKNWQFESSLRKPDLRADLGM